MRATAEADLGTSAQRVVKRATAAGWSTVAVVSEGVEDGRATTVLTVRGRRAGGGRFVVLWIDGAFEDAWWWTRHHRSVVRGYRREDRWVKQRYAGRLWYPGTRVEVLEPRLVHDPELDEVVTWETETLERTRLGSLSELLGRGGANPLPALLDSEPTQE